MLKDEKPPVAATTEGQSKTLEAIDIRLIANRSAADNHVVAYRASDGSIWRYPGKKGRVLAMLATKPEGVTQHDTYPWHTRLGGTIHAMRCDGLAIDTQREGRYRHARYRLTTLGSLIGQGEIREASNG